MTWRAWDGWRVESARIAVSSLAWVWLRDIIGLGNWTTLAVLLPGAFAVGFVGAALRDRRL